jgi:hypothetical protein
MAIMWAARGAADAVRDVADAKATGTILTFLCLGARGAGMLDARGLEAVYLIWGVFANPGSAAAGADGRAAPACAVAVRDRANSAAVPAAMRRN